MSALQPTVVRLPAATHVAIKKLAAENDRTMAQEIRRAIRLHLEREAET